MGWIPKPPIIKYTDQDCCDTFTKLKDWRSKKSTGLSLKGLIKEISEESEGVPGNIYDEFELTINYAYGKITRLAESIARETLPDDRYSPTLDLIKVIDREIYDGISETLEEDFRKGKVGNIVKELPIKLGLVLV